MRPISSLDSEGSTGDHFLQPTSARQVLEASRSNTPISPRSSTQRHTIALDESARKELADMLAAEEEATNSVARARINDLEITFSELKITKKIRVTGDLKIDELKAKAIDVFVKAVPAKKAPRLAKTLAETEFYLPRTGIWCVSSRSISSYWFVPGEALHLKRKKRSMKQIRVVFDGSTHTIDFSPSVTTIEGLIQSLPKLDVRDYSAYRIYRSTSMFILSFILSFIYLFILY